jgi:hypothetical protein
MITAHTPQPTHAEAPAIVKRLRKLFDERMLDLYAVASVQRPVLENGTSPMVHVDFPADALQVTAVYHTVEDRFTQLIARAADEAHHERPSFTISLFL